MTWLLRGLIAAIVAVPIVAAFGITMSIRQSTQFTNDCQAAGGHIYDAGKDWLCLSNDGRVIQP